MKHHKSIEFAPFQFANTAKDGLDGLLTRRGIGPYTVDHYSIVDLIEKMIDERIEALGNIADASA
jgi:hypothetical protein